MKTTILSIRVPVEDFEDLRAAAERNRVSVSEFARLLLGIRPDKRRIARIDELADKIQQNLGDLRAAVDA